MTANFRGYSIYSPKSLYKKTSNGILRGLKAAFKTGESKVPRPLSVLPSLIWQACVKQPALTHTPSQLSGREKKDATKMNFSSCSDHSWVKTTAIFSSLTFEFEYFFFSGLLSLQHKTLVLWYIVLTSMMEVDFVWFCWVGLSVISTIVCYLMPNPVYIYIYIRFVNTYCW